MLVCGILANDKKYDKSIIISRIRSVPYKKFSYIETVNQNIF